MIVSTLGIVGGIFVTFIVVIILGLYFIIQQANSAR